MSSILKKMASLYGKLQWAYAQGVIPYPRVANDYIELKNLKFYEYPHQPLIGFDKYSVPLSHESYPFIKETIPLYLTNLSISTPATLMKNFTYIDEMLDDELMLRNHAKGIEPQLDKIIDIFRETAQEFYMKESEDGIRLYEEDPLVLNNIELLHTIAKDGDVISDFKMNIMPYSIDLSPSNNNEFKKSEKEDEDEKAISPLFSPSAFKQFVSPTRCFSKHIIKDSIKIQNINEFIMLENIRIGYISTGESLGEVASRHDVLKENSQYINIQGNM